MYSIFHPFTGDNQNAPTSGDTTQPPSLDGVCDHQDENSYSHSKMDFRNLVMKDSTQCTAIESKVDTTPSKEIDPNLDRRKRRRISREDHIGHPDGHDNDYQSTDLQALTYNSQISANANSEGIVGQNVSGTVQISGDTDLSRGHAVIKTPRKRTPRKRQAPADARSSDGPVVQPGTNLDIQSSPSRQKSSIPKKNLSLHTNGKLMSSPTRKPDTGVKVQEFSDKKASSNRNYKMKNGKFVQSLEIILKYGNSKESRSGIGQKIDHVLSKVNDTTQSGNQVLSSKTHPFFLGKMILKPHPGDASMLQSEATDNESESTSRNRGPIAWKDIKFTTQKSSVFKSSDSVRAAWPPLSLQHVGNELPNQARHDEMRNLTSKAKLKASLIQLRDNESILHEYARKLGLYYSNAKLLSAPQKELLGGTNVALNLESTSKMPYMHDAISLLRSALMHGSSPFDRGQCPGPNTWSTQYAPKKHSEVLQPTASTLYEWLQGLAIHNVKTGLDTNATAKKLKNLARKRRRKPKDELDDFIVNSDDENEGGKTARNAILISGPNGCGKTASVYAVAKELGFEVFEIHPGMRRSAKDIFDRVGDMAHNHLVRNGSDISRGSSVAPAELDMTIDTDMDRKQTTIANTLGSKASTKVKVADNAPTTKAKKEQKQSLILFEEVDLLFDDDKGFWNGVQSLISNAKRPVVLTCNDPSSVPMDELNLYSSLKYDPIEHELAVEYLIYLAAAEGHVLDRAALSYLYESKGQDLRASITELGFWCQMTVGSKQGGLDWMAQNCSGKPRVDEAGHPLRTFSHNTYQKCLDLLPQVTADTEAAIRFDQDCLGIAASEWCDFGMMGDLALTNGSDTNLQVLSLLSDITEARSAMDLFDDHLTPVIASVTAGLIGTSTLTSDRDVVSQRYAQRAMPEGVLANSLMTSFKPITVEKPTFPPSQGRLAPSIEAFLSSVAIDIAPYVRCIVNFDRCLEQHRDEHFGSQGKARKTRAARAAAEGGDKSSTRSERWFPQDLDFDKVLRTGGEWPQWYSEQQKNVSLSSAGSPSTSSET